MLLPGSLCCHLLSRTTFYLASPFSAHRFRQPLSSRIFFRRPLTPCLLSHCLRSIFCTSFSPHLLAPPLKNIEMTFSSNANIPAHKLCTRMRLWELPDMYVIEPTDGLLGPYLTISRTDGAIGLADELPQDISIRAPKIQTIFGVLGLLKLFTGTYLIVITEHECVGSYMKHPIFRVSSLQILPCGHPLNEFDEKRETDVSLLLHAIKNTSGLYFSYNVNLTLSIQRLYHLDDEVKELPLWRQAEPRFVWNSYMMEVLIENKVDPYLLPVVQGSFHHFQAALGRKVFDVTIVARRCTRRAGTRMWRRGADSDGYVANFVETEQIVEANGSLASFLQVRGSIPILWEQIVDLSYKPPFKILKPEEAPRIAERHFLDLRKRYGSVLAIDLVNKHGSEGYLSEKFSSAMQNIFCDDLRYIHFDFHCICGHIHFSRLSLLYDQVADFLCENGFFMLDTNQRKVKEQLGVVRTNCIDCLDRTNVTQSMIGRRMLEKQLVEMKIFTEEEPISAHSDFDEKFRCLWADHGDDISMQYSGTQALKRDLVMHGKQTIPGMLMDGWNAMFRYYQNNFCDGVKQDAIDLLHGHYIISVRRGAAPQARLWGLENMASLPLALSLVITGLLFASMSMRQVGHGLQHIIFSAVCGGLSISVAAFIRANGWIFCNRPRLNKPAHDNHS